MHAEGSLNYDALMFVPSRAPWDMYSKDYQRGLALYSANVLIMDKCEELLPDYFGFVRGVVDSSDLTLNISRETLQHNGQLRAISRRLEKKIKADLASMRDDDREAYERFFEQFGRTLKFGIYQSYGMAKDTLADLLLFYSAKQQNLTGHAGRVPGRCAGRLRRHLLRRRRFPRALGKHAARDYGACQGL